MVNGLVTVFPTSIRPRMRKINWDGLEEIRVRIGWPVELIYGNHNEWLGNYDSMIDRKCLDEMLNYITGYSIYAMDEEIKQGYITFSGGHRIGITGHATYETLRDSKDLRITSIVDIGGLNIRIAHERKGCAKRIVPYLRKGEGIYNTLIFAAPGVGKTTYLRDIIRILSEGDEGHSGLKISVIDERSEIAACVDGKPQNDLGKRTDVLDACPKELGMKMVLRTMSPDVIAVDVYATEVEGTYADGVVTVTITAVSGGKTLVGAATVEVAVTIEEPVTETDNVQFVAPTGLTVAEAQADETAAIAAAELSVRSVEAESAGVVGEICL